MKRNNLIKQFLIVGILLMVSCKLEKEKGKYELGNIFLERKSIKVWVFENIFDKNEIQDEDSFLRIGLKEDLIQIYELKDIIIILIRYHPYWSKNSKIECHLMRSKKVNKSIDIRGDRYGVGEVSIKDIDKDGELELVHELEHKVPMVNVIQVHQIIYDLAIEEINISKRVEWIIKELNCEREGGGRKISYLNKFIGGQIVSEKVEETYNCDDFPN